MDDNPHPNGLFCPEEGPGGGIRGVVNFRPIEDQTPEMIPQDIGVDSLPVMEEEDIFFQSIPN